MPTRENPRLHGGSIVVNTNCTTPCQLTVGGYVTIHRRHVPLGTVTRSLTAGPHRFRVNLSRRNRTILLRTIRARQTVRAVLTLSATQAGVAGESTGGSVSISLHP
jgi:hypothetical protein